MIEIGFRRNPYDVYILNKVIDGKKYRLAWNIKLLKISHISDKVVTQITAYLKGKIEKIGSHVDKDN